MNKRIIKCLVIISSNLFNILNNLKHLLLYFAERDLAVIYRLAQFNTEVSKAFPVMNMNKYYTLTFVFHINFQLDDLVCFLIKYNTF